MQVIIQDMQRDQYALCKFNLVIQLGQGYDLTIQGCRLINGRNGQFVGMPQIQWVAQNGEKRKMNTVKMSDQMNSYIREIVVTEYNRIGGSLGGGQQRQYNNQGYQQPAQQAQGFPPPQGGYSQGPVPAGAPTGNPFGNTQGQGSPF